VKLAALLKASMEEEAEKASIEAEAARVEQEAEEA